jgi:hypothetical protein
MSNRKIVLIETPGHSIAAGNRAKCHFNVFFPGYFVFKNEKVKVKVKCGFVLYTGLSFAI